MRRTVGTLVSVILIGIPLASSEEVVFINPVVDLWSERLSTYGQATQVLYDEQPFSGTDGVYDCMRTAQALFNETATVIIWDKQRHELCVELSHWIVEHNGEPRHPRFWCWDTHVVKKKALKKSFIGSQHYLILKKPFYDQSRDITYSAGTRFVRVSDYDNDVEYGVLLYAPEFKKNIVRTIPDDCVILPDPDVSCDARQRLCKDLIREWAHGTTIIPYVWGGSSYCKRLPDDLPKKQSAFFFHRPINFWMREMDDTSGITGFDCSSLITRAAQIVGIHYFFKTSHAAFALGREVTTLHDVREGDLVVWPGHMFMITDLKKGLLVESKGYDAGFGKVQEMHLEERLKGISSYKKLFEACKQGMPLQELDSKGNVIRVIPRFKIIALCG